MSKQNPITSKELETISADALKSMTRTINVYGIQEESPNFAVHDDNSIDIFPFSKGLAVLNYVIVNYVSKPSYKDRQIRVILQEKGSGHESRMNRVFDKNDKVIALAVCPDGLKQYPEGAIQVPGTTRDNMYEYVGKDILGMK